MQTQRVIKTIQWLAEKFQDLEPSFIQLRRQEIDVGMLALAANQLGRFCHTVEQNPEAVRVLKAFQLENLLSPRYFDISKQAGASVARITVDTIQKFRLMTGCAAALEELTGPQAKIAQDEAEIDINVLDRESLSLETVIEVLSNLRPLSGRGGVFGRKKADSARSHKDREWYESDYQSKGSGFTHKGN